MPDSALLQAAIEDNIAWCSAICASHRSVEQNSQSTWVNLTASPSYYPNIITRRPDATSEVIQLVTKIRQNGISGSWGIKDSFADLDLAALGFSMAIEGQWFADEPSSRQELAADAWEIARRPEDLSLWEKAWSGNTEDRIFKDSLLADPRIRFWLLRRQGEIAAGCISFESVGAMGLSNWFSRRQESAFDLGIMPAIAGSATQKPIVFWAADDETAIPGFKPLGRLRVWMSAPASA